MSPLSPRRELSENHLFEPTPRRWSRTMSDEPDSDPDAPGLPPPVVTTPGHKPKKTIRIDGRGLHVHWARFRRRLAGTSPSTSSLVEDSAAGSNVGLRGDSQGGCQYEDDGEVDEVVVDRKWSDDNNKSSVSLSDEQDLSHDKSGHITGPGPSTDRDSHTGASGFWGLCTPLIILRWRVFPAIVDFFSPKFLNLKSELHYVKENWFMRKSLAIWSSLFLVINWTVNVALIPGPVLLIDKIFLYGIAPACIFPIPVLVIYDWPRDRPNAYQVVLAISIWCWGVYQLLYIFLCGLYNPNFSVFRCGRRDFLSMFYFVCAVPTVALFGLRQKRFPAVICATIWGSFASAVILPHRKTWTRNVLNFVIFQGFLVCVHYMLEMSERRLYILRDQLKVQFHATQKAQINERKAADSKRRLTSYVFHEVRVPLNTALLAVQNMEASGIVPRAQEIEFKALEGSLSMMSKVLNDVLDFNRMDSGRFESVSKPYSFHQVIRGLFVPLRLATDARHLELVTDLDPCIDKVARDAVHVACGLDPEKAPEQLGDGLVVGDETRLMQIITNLASNACKFTPPGGRLRIATRLIVPTCSHHNLSADSSAKEGKNSEKMEGRNERMSDALELSAHLLDRHNRWHAPQRDWIVVRIEVTDTGYGIPPKEMVQSKLFSAFNQTEQGKLQGGKGTGLGLALVRQIVKRSGGRLGVTSRVGKGSTFWVELALGIGSQAILPRVPAPPPLDDEELGNGRSTQLPMGPMDSVPHELSPAPRLIIETAPPRDSVGQPRSSGSSSLSPMGSQRSLSAMHTLMEQGGPVEIGLKADMSPSVITRTIGDALALPATPEEETDAILFPSPSSLSPPSPGLPAQDAPRTSTSERPEAPANSSTPQRPSPASANSSDSVIPQVQPQPQPSSGGPDGPLTVVPSGLPVLVVDDDSLTRTLMNRMLSRLGCKVFTAENGEVALEMILGGYGGRFAVVFLDNQMPVMSGLSMVAKLREARRSDFVVGVTGNALLSDQEEYLQAGVDRVLTKPVLERSLRNMLALARQRATIRECS
ncbi:hypothetical protein BJV78DRAFT_91293 [Lactifluus subvellereus]|nr:hypothetical protein BJV78DRAFT_91293 [Lactifluus subvellereus]